MSQRVSAGKLKIKKYASTFVNVFFHVYESEREMTGQGTRMCVIQPFRISLKNARHSGSRKAQFVCVRLNQFVSHT